MAAISLSLPRGVQGTKISDFTVGVLAPNAGDFEVRFNTTDTNAVTIPIKDVILGLEAFIRALETDAQIITPLGL